MLESLVQVAVPSPELEEQASLSRNFVWTLAGNVLYAACQWGILVAIAKLGTPTMLGQFALGLAVATPVFMLTNLQLRFILATDARHEYRLGHYFALRILGTVLGLALIAGVVSIARFRRETAIVVVLISLAKAAESLSDIIYGFWQKQEHFDKIALPLAGRGAGSLVALAAVLYFTHSIALAAAAMALSWALWLVTYERVFARKALEAVLLQERLVPEWDPVRLQQLLRTTFPLGLVAVLASLNVSIPRYSVEHFLGEGALGYFAAAAYVQVACNTVIIAAEQSASPRLAQFCASPRKAFLSLLTKMLLLAGVLGAGGVSVAFFFGRPLLAFLYRPDYARYGGMFTLLMLAGGLNYVVSMLCCAMTVLRMFRVQMILSFISTATILMGSWLLVPRFGLMGAAYAVLGTAIVSCLGTVFLSVEAWHPKTSEW